MSDSMPLMMNLQGSPSQRTASAPAADKAEDSSAPFDGLLQGLFAMPAETAQLLTGTGAATTPGASGTGLPIAGKTLPAGDEPAPAALLVLVQENARDPAGASLAALPASGNPALVPVDGLDAEAEAMATASPYRLLTAQWQGQVDADGRAAAVFERHMIQLLNPESLEPVAGDGDADGIAPAPTGSNGHASLFHQALSGLSATRAETASPAIPVPPQHPQWGQALGERLQWLVGQHLQEAEIRLDPPELGSLEVKIQIHKDTATISFVTPHAQVRDAVEAATSRLRDMLGEVGINLGDVNVSQESFGQQQMAGQGQPQGHVQPDSLQLATDEAELRPGLAPLRRGQGLLDTYA